VKEIEAGMVYRDQNVWGDAFPLNHGSLPGFGYESHATDRTIAISSDTAPSEDCLEAYQECDVLIHEVYSSKGLEGRSRAWQRYHSAVHTSSIQLAEIASAVKPGLLILYHQLLHGVSEREPPREVQERYDGAVVSSRDLGVY
jgi:ribonuclease BN (tRNA processing enzyme)